jgi:hypothetical protein
MVGTSISNRIVVAACVAANDMMTDVDGARYLFMLN